MYSLYILLFLHVFIMLYTILPWQKTIRYNRSGWKGDCLQVNWWASMAELELEWTWTWVNLNLPSPSLTPWPLHHIFFLRWWQLCGRWRPQAHIYILVCLPIAALSDFYHIWGRPLIGKPCVSHTQGFKLCGNIVCVKKLSPLKFSTAILSVVPTERAGSWIVPYCPIPPGQGG